jgi:Phosphotransferase enzyme family
MTDFPRRPEDLTVEWLAPRIGRDPTDAIMRLERVGEGRGMLGTLVRVTLHGGGSANLPPTTVIAKFASDREETLQTARRAGTHRREIGFYDQLASSCEARVPKCYGAWYDESTAQFLLLLEDIDVDTTVDQLVGLDAGRAALVLEQVARVHARWWRDERLGELDWLPSISGRQQNLSILSERGWPLLRPLLVADGGVSDAELEASTSLLGGIGAALGRLGSTSQTLVHSDLRLDNILFTPTGEVVLVDWQGLGIGTPAWDLAYFLSQSMSTPMRRAHEGALLDGYVDAMRRNGVDASSEELLAGYDDALLYGLAVSSSICLVSAPGDARAKQLAITMGRRAIDALGDAGRL